MRSLVTRFLMFPQFVGGIEGLTALAALVLLFLSSGMFRHGGSLLISVVLLRILGQRAKAAIPRML